MRAAPLPAVALAGCITVSMPGRSYEGAPPPLTPQQIALRDTLERRVRVLAESIGERNTRRPAALQAAADWVKAELGAGVVEHAYEVDGVRAVNLELVLPGSPENVVIGAHYDSALGTPGADDNASGTAALLAIADALRGRSGGRTVRLVAFTNEEEPWFDTPEMGSTRYAQRLKSTGVDVVAMLSLETMGYYTDAPESQEYPFPMNLFYPDVGNFLAFVSNGASEPLLEEVITSFRAHAKLPSEGGAAPASIPGVDWSDHLGFWEQGYPALMVTDTAPNRNPHYHEPTDTPDKLDYHRLALAVDALIQVVEELRRGKKE